MEVDELRLQQFPVLPPISPTAFNTISPSARMTRARARRASVTATLNDGPDLPSPRLALFVSPVLGPPQLQHVHSPADKRRRRLRLSVIHAKQPRTPRTLKLQHYADSSPFNLTSPLHHLSLLSPANKHDNPDTAQPTTTTNNHSHYSHHHHHSQPPAFLHPLTHLSALGLTLTPPTLNWSTAASVLAEAELRASDLLCRAVSCDVERVVAVDRLIGVDMRNELREVEGEERRVREKRWREEEVVKQAREDEERKEQHVLIAAEIRRNKAEVEVARAALLQQRYIEWRYRDEDVEEEEMADDQRLARYDVYHAAQLRISLAKQEESAAWKNEWRDIQLLHQQRMAEERAASLARQQAEQQRINAAYTAARLKAKQGRLQLTIQRARTITSPFLPSGTVAYFVAQLVAEQPIQSLEYPAPLSELRYSPFTADVEAAVGGVEGESDGVAGSGEGGVEVGWGCEWMAKSVAKSTLVISWQCCDREQKERFDKWIRKKERQRRNDAATATTANEEQQQQPSKARPPKSTTTKSKSNSTKSSTNNNNSQPTAPTKRPTKAATTSTSTEEQISVVKRVKKLKELRSHSHRHVLITRVLELGRVELKLRDIREREAGEWDGMVEVTGVGWQAKAAADERKRRRKREKQQRAGNDVEGMESPGVLSPLQSPRPGTGMSSMSTARFDSPPFNTNSSSTTTRAPTTKTERDQQRLTASHLTMNPASLYPTRPSQKRSELQLLLMTDKERQQYQDDEEHKERLRRDKEDKERRKWSRKVGELWIGVRLLPLDADGKLIVREGEKRVEAEVKERDEEEEDELDEGMGGEEGEEKEEDGDETEDREGDQNDEEEEEREVVAVKTGKKGRQQKSTSKKEKDRGLAGKKSESKAEAVSAEQLRSKAFPILD